MKIFQVALGILAAIGGFVDIGDLVFNVSAGATFGYQLLWVIVDRSGRDHRLLRDVRTSRGGLGEGGLRRRARASRLQGGARRADLGAGRQPDDAHRGDRRRRDLPAAALGAFVPLADPRRGRGARGRGLGDAVRMDRAHLRLRRSVHARVRRRGREAPSRLGGCRPRIRPAHGHAEPAAVRVLRHRLARRRDDAVRGLLLLLRRRRGALGPEGSRAEQGERA